MIRKEGLRPRNMHESYADIRSAFSESNKKIDSIKRKEISTPTKLASIFLLASLPFLSAKEVNSDSYSETQNKPVDTHLQLFDSSLEQISDENEIAKLPSGLVETEIVSGLTQPHAMEFAPDGRLFIAERGGQIRVIKDGVLLSEPFLKLDTDGQLHGIAFDPDFENNQYIYAYYTNVYDQAVIEGQVSRFKARSVNSDIADVESENVIIRTGRVPIPWTNIIGGALQFGADGKLYIGVGDYGYPPYAQDLSKLQGKILRINPDGTIPKDNPSSFFTFYDYTAHQPHPAIWALGFHNPSKFAADPKTGTIFINDIGAVAAEPGIPMDVWNEINVLEKAGNYGWSAIEGSSHNANLVDPNYEYRNVDDYGSPTFTAITGGDFYRGDTFPGRYDGVYFFADMPGGWIKYLDTKTLKVSNFLDNARLPIDLRVGPDGAIYYLSFDFSSGGSVHKIQAEDAVESPTTIATSNHKSTPSKTEKPISTSTEVSVSIEDAIVGQTPIPGNKIPALLPNTGSINQAQGRGYDKLNEESMIAGLLLACAGALGSSAIIYRRRPKN